MEYSNLGRSELNISRIGFGCMSLKAGQADFSKIIHAAADRGINYFDTADLYENGLNEVALGFALKDIRKKVVIATKAGNQWRPDLSGWDWNPRKDYIIQCAEESLRRLQTDYIDLFQLHGGTIEDHIEESIEAFETLMKQGKIRYYGLSSIRPNVIKKHVEYGKLTCVMIQYSLLDRRPEEHILNYLSEHSIGVVVRGSVGTGLLAGKPSKKYLNWNEEQVADIAGKLATMENEDRKSSQAAIQYILQHKAVNAAVVGIRTLQQLKDAVRVMDLPPLNNEEMAFLQNAIPAAVYTNHR